MLHNLDTDYINGSVVKILCAMKKHRIYSLFAHQTDQDTNSL
jgi:hypothetical protein